MYSSFFISAARSPTRQKNFRRMVIVHLLMLSGGAWMLALQGQGENPALLGHLLLIVAIVEGAVLLGWRLTQLPKTQALEFLLVTPLHPWRVFLAEAAVGLAQLALLGLVGLPILVGLAGEGYLREQDIPPLLYMPFTWGALTGLGLTVWAYEPQGVRRWGERVLLGLVVLQLLVGMVFGEHVWKWLDKMPEDVGTLARNSLEAFSRYNPFAVLTAWLGDEPALARPRLIGVELTALIVLAVLALRCAFRLRGHYQDRHYRIRQRAESADKSRDLSFSFRLLPFSFRDQPLAWWAVKRVTEYSGRINVWLAGGFGLLYAAHTVAGKHWPSWLAQQVFVVVDQSAGPVGLASILVVLAAVPAAFQYGLWDASVQDRCHRLELLLLTRLQGVDYWQAAAAAAWRRGRGYFCVAIVLWVSAVIADVITPLDALASFAMAIVLWGLYFAIGFQAFTRGTQASGRGMSLTIGLPLIAWLLFGMKWKLLGGFVPIGAVYAAGAGLPARFWLPGAIFAALISLLISEHAQSTCDRELRRWYDAHHGQKVLT